MKSFIKYKSTLLRRCLIAGVAVMAWAFCLVACKKEVHPEQIAAQAAKVYYENLIAGDAAQFVDGSAQIDSIPADYRDSQIAAVRQYMAQITEAHGGLASVEVDTATVTQDGMQAHVTLRFHYADSTTNRVLVPMVCKDGTWLLR